MTAFRHHVRFFPASDQYVDRVYHISLVLNAGARDFGGRTKNLPAGWVSNGNITSPLCKGDFWMLSHAGLLGSKTIVIFLILTLNLVCLV